MIGHRKFAWKVENLPPSEWFDFDREENIMPVKTQVDYDDILQQSQDEKWNFVPTLCPWCLNGAVQYGNEDERGNRYDHSWICSCSWCNKTWEEDFNKE